ncbi:hypothetical protein SAMN05421539_101229 [Jannaschia seohaensis]|uniref:Uncharacterized protein n=1 Tax=Jannaschia seohaensis TaxID=475081 RepID=A0A2Y9A671_9RHOB|nr:hypothetical protein BCF38_101229 [Jannaschia seohaensis]SSA38099.1 hypothetical protein SAMN05421539_101229 [Jannaschia seohaensis]
MLRRGARIRFQAPDLRERRESRSAPRIAPRAVSQGRLSAFTLLAIRKPETGVATYARPRRPRRLSQVARTRKPRCFFGRLPVVAARALRRVVRINVSTSLFLLL